MHEMSLCRFPVEQTKEAETIRLYMRGVWGVSMREKEKEIDEEEIDRWRD